MDEPVSWSLEWNDAKSRIELQIHGRLDAATGVASADRLVELADGRPFTLVADLTDMRGYDREAREAWQRAFTRMPGQMQGVTFVGLGPVFRMAAATVCLATRIKAEFHPDREAWLLVDGAA